MTKPKFLYPSFVVICAISFLALGCSKPTNTLNRPTSEANTKVNTNEQNKNSTQDSGEVAGAEVVQLPTKKIKVDDKEIEVEVADTDPAMQRGLSYREKLDEGKGMIFNFTDSEVKRPGFWMKDMLFSIDIVWIDGDKVIAVEDNVPVPAVDKDYTIYYPPSDITHVLEVPAGWTIKNNVTVGSNISL